MELLISIFVFSLIVILTLGVYIPFLRIGEEEIVRNINDLKQYEWFQDILGDKSYYELIVYDSSVRKTIGKFNNKRFDNNFFRNRYREKLQKTLNQKSNGFA